MGTQRLSFINVVRYTYSFILSFKGGIYSNLNFAEDIKHAYDNLL